MEAFNWQLVVNSVVYCLCIYFIFKHYIWNSVHLSITTKAAGFIKDEFITDVTVTVQPDHKTHVEIVFCVDDSQGTEVKYQFTFDQETEKLENIINGIIEELSLNKNQYHPILNAVKHSMKSFFLWTHKEAKEKSISQIATSACGPTAALNLYKALNVKHKNDEKESEDDKSIPSNINISRLRNYDSSSLTGYLMSRIKAGTIHSDIIEYAQNNTNTDIVGVFFCGQASSIYHLMQSKNIYINNKMFQWIYEWMSNGGILLCTFNYFMNGFDAWHHQMIYGVDNKYVYLSNPVEKVNYLTFLNLISSNPWMVIPKDHVIERMDSFNQTNIQNDLFKNRPWIDLSVGQQIEQVIKREKDDKPKDNKKPWSGYTRFEDIVIPYGALSGITIFAKTNSIAGIQLKQMKTRKVWLPAYKKYVDVADIDF